MITHMDRWKDRTHSVLDRHEESTRWILVMIGPKHIHSYLACPRIIAPALRKSETTWASLGT